MFWPCFSTPGTFFCFVSSPVPSDFVRFSVDDYSGPWVYYHVLCFLTIINVNELLISFLMFFSWCIKRYRFLNISSVSWNIARCVNSNHSFNQSIISPISLNQAIQALVHRWIAWAHFLFVYSLFLSLTALAHILFLKKLVDYQHGHSWPSDTYELVQWRDSEGHRTWSSSFTYLRVQSHCF